MCNLWKHVDLGCDNLCECVNCGKQMRDNFEYCRICGTKLESEVPDDYSTDMLNVFRYGDGYMYLFSENGNQVVLKADSLDELACMVRERKFPWEFKKLKSNEEPHKNETSHVSEPDFMNASGLNGFDEIPSSLDCYNDDEFHIHENGVEMVENKSGEEGFDELNFQSGKDYVESIEDVGFGKILDRNITGCVPTIWGPDNSSRAVNLRRKMFK